ncbi:MAG: metallophosphoesterase family protein [Chloroflexi bacterium]|nr:metallophosphoesterase family protein [Chloroflexota bacterium]
MMKIGLISDIHSELNGLESALALLHRHNIDQIICMGDVVEIGRGRGDQAAALLHELAIPCVMGNHDQYSLGHHLWLLKNGDPHDPTLQSRLLKPETFTFLQHLPETLRYQWADQRVVISHGTVWTLHPQSRPIIFKRILKIAEADILILGHTHVPMRVNVEGRWVLNPGSVSERGSRTCAILTLPEIRFVVYDIVTGKIVREAVIEYPNIPEE